MDVFFGVFTVLFFLVFFLVLGVIIFTFARSISRWNQNNHSPVLTVEARVVTKRTQVHYNHAAGEPMHTMNSTTYFATFQVESGDRMELHLSGSEYGMLAEGDFGKLTFQGTRYLGFERM